MSILIQLYSQKLGPNGSIGDGNFPSLFSHLYSYKTGKERGSDTRSFFTHPCSHKMGERAEWLGGGEGEGEGEGGGLVSSLHWESAVLAQLSDSRILHRMFPSQDPSLPSQVDGSFLSFFTPPPPPPHTHTPPPPHTHFPPHPRPSPPTRSFLASFLCTSAKPTDIRGGPGLQSSCQCRADNAGLSFFLLLFLPALKDFHHHT